MKVLGLALMAALWVTGCGAELDSQSSETKILRGELINESQKDARRQSTVALTTNKSRAGSSESLISQNKSFCSGTIISETVIVTAAHCLEKFDPKTRQKQGLLFGEDKNYLISFETTVNERGIYIPAKKVIPHPDWDPAATLSPFSKKAPNDIGIVILSEPIPAKAKPIKIASANLEMPKRSKIQLAGYGVTKKRSKPDTGKLRQVEVKMKKVNNDRKMFTVGKFLRGACAGDSGGPAYVQVGNKLELAGATSTGMEIFGYCVGITNNYTDVRLYKDWIDKTVEENEEN